MDFFKRNIMLSLVIIGTFVIILAVSAIGIVSRSGYDKESAALKKNIEQLDKNNKEKPAPHPENIRRIGVDAEEMNSRAVELDRHFGRFYQRDFERLASKMITLSKEYESIKADYDREQAGERKKELDERMRKLRDAAYIHVRADFKKFYDELPDKSELPVVLTKAQLSSAGDVKIAEKFFEKYLMREYDSDDAAAKSRETAAYAERKKMFDKYFGDFIAAISAKTLELRTVRRNEKEFSPAEYALACEYLLFAAGLPRSSDGLANFKSVLTIIQHNMLVRKIIPGDNLTLQDVQNLTMKADEVYEFKLVPEAFMQLEILRNVFDIMKRSSVARVNSVKRHTLLNVQRNERFVKYKFTVDIEGPNDSIRKFLNGLNAAYEDDCAVYVVRDVILSRPNPEDLSKYSSSGQASSSSQQPSSRSRSRNSREQQEDSASSEQLSVQAATGASLNVQAVIIFECVVSVKNDLQRIQQDSGN